MELTPDMIADWIDGQIKAIPDNVSNLHYEDFVRSMARRRTLAEVRDYIFAKQMEEAECEKRKFEFPGSCSEGLIFGTKSSTQTIGDRVKAVVSMMSSG